MPAKVQQIVIYVLATLVLVFVFGKILGQLLHTFFDQLSTSGGKKKNVDIDVLIKRQEELIRAGGLGKLTLKTGERVGAQSNPAACAPAVETRKKTYRTEDEYLREFDARQKQNDKAAVERVKEVLGLFDNMQWGEGKQFQQIRGKIAARLQVPVELDRISNGLRYLMLNDVLISTSSKSLPGMEQIEEVMTMKIFIDALLNEARFGSGPHFSRLAKEHEMKALEFIKALDYLVHAQLKKSDELHLEGLIDADSHDSLKINSMGQQSINQFMLETLLTDDKKFFRPRADFEKMLAKWAALFSSLANIPEPTSKDDLDTALKIFGVDRKTPFEEVKKIYKSLAAQLHPDRLAGSDFPPQFMAKANKNFTSMQNAYDILKRLHDQ